MNTMKKKEILYVMHIPWGWIKQRPQFLAELLTKKYDVTVVFRKSLRFRKNVKKYTEKSSLLDINHFFIFPFDIVPILKHIHFLEYINVFLLRFQFHFNRYDYIWITSLHVYRYLWRALPLNACIIYDCMDDDFEFPHIKKSKALTNNFTKLEKEIVNRATLIFCSSDYLKKKIYLRTNISKEIIVVNNAIFLPEKGAENEKLPIPFNIIEHIPNCFTYIGTVADWFDFDTVLYTLERNSDITFVLVGPREVDIPKHERLIYLGPCEYKYVMTLMQKSTALIMPFKLNELIYSVNPVKLYEYIYASKPIISLKYFETEKFRDYVYLYSTQEEFGFFCEKICQNNSLVKNTKENNLTFAEMNTWEQRINQIFNHIEK